MKYIRNFKFINSISNEIKVNDKGITYFNDNFDFSSLDLKTLEGCLNIIYRNFHCYKNELKTLEYGQLEVSGDYISVTID